MTTVINNPGGGNNSDSSAGWVIGIIIAIILVFVLIRWGIPAMRGNRSAGTTNINVQLPTTGGGTSTGQ